jgi:hypothetical protein
VSGVRLSPAPPHSQLRSDLLGREDYPLIRAHVKSALNLMLFR